MKGLATILAALLAQDAGLPLERDDAGVEETNARWERLLDAGVFPVAASVGCLRTEANMCAPLGPHLGRGWWLSPDALVAAERAINDRSAQVIALEAENIELRQSIAKPFLVGVCVGIALSAATAVGAYVYVRTR